MPQGKCPWHHRHATPDGAHQRCRVVDIVSTVVLAAANGDRPQLAEKEAQHQVGEQSTAATEPPPPKQTIIMGLTVSFDTCRKSTASSCGILSSPTISMPKINCSARGPLPHGTKHGGRRGHGKTIPTGSVPVRPSTSRPPGCILHAHTKGTCRHTQRQGPGLGHPGTGHRAVLMGDRQSVGCFTRKIDTCNCDGLDQLGTTGSGLVGSTNRFWVGELLPSGGASRLGGVVSTT